MSRTKLRSTAAPLAAGIALAVVAVAVTTGGAASAEEVPAADRDAGRDALAVAAAIDRAVEKRLAEAKIPPSPAADDAEFLRRVTLDIAGRIPTAEKTLAFLDSKDPAKRRKLIDELLAGKDYGRHFGTAWRNLLAPPGNPVKGKAPPDRFSPWLADQFNRGRGWDQIVTDLLTAEGDIAKVPQTGFLMANSENFRPQANLLAASATRLFLGVRLGCAECHDHPFGAWKQTDFWGTAAFFGRLRNTGKKGPPFILTEEADPQPPGKDEPAVIRTAPGGSVVLPPSAGKAAGKTVTARFLGGAGAPLDDEKPFRPVFAAWVTGRANPYFARAFVNRTWSQLFGRGLVHPADDFRDDNPAANPAVLTLLAHEFRDSGYDCKHLIRCVCNSQTYQRTSRPLPANEKDRELGSHMAVKVLSPEAFYDSLAVVLAADKSAPGGKGKSPLPEAREDFLLFFRTQGEAEDENAFRQGIPQFLKRLNGVLSNQGAPFLDRLIRSGASRERILEMIYLTALSRRPAAEEVELLSKYLDRQPDAEKGYAGVLWILLNSGEFVLNH